MADVWTGQMTDAWGRQKGLEHLRQKRSRRGQPGVQGNLKVGQRVVARGRSICKESG